MGMNLFDGSNDDVEDISKIEVNKEFAKRYEHNKKREDLQRLEELKKKGLVSESGSDSESDSDSWDKDAINSTKDEIQFFEALLRVRSRDPALMEKDVKLFDSSSESGDEDEEEGKGKGENGKKKEKKGKKKYLKDVNAEHLIELGPEFGGREDEDEEEEDVKKVTTYSDEQEELRKSFLDAVEEAEKEVGDEGDLLRMKSKEDEEDEDEEDGEEIKERVDKYFENDEKDSLFLKEFFKNRMWIDKEEGKTPAIDDDAELSDDEEEIERQEDYEREFNFRFEEGAGDRVQSHSRIVGDSVRKKENARKEQRKRKKERMEQAELERQEEVKRLKNLKKKEIMEKINRIKLVAGLDDGVDIPLTDADLEEDFDPEKYDKKMKDAFGDEYYVAEDVDSDFGSDMEKPDFEKEDELLGLPEDWDVCKPGEGFLSERQKYLQTLENHEGEAVDEGEDGVEEDEEEPSEGKRKRKRKMSLKEKITLDEDLEELYKLDYEDTIGDLKTRFKYKTVASKRYGLSADEILELDEKELNQVVPVKTLAPYREKEWKVPHTKLMALKKKKEQETHERRFAKDEGNKHKKRKTEEHALEAGKDKEQHTDEALSRKEKRKLRKQEIKISEARLMAYGKIPSKSKGKSKQ